MKWLFLIGKWLLFLLLFLLTAVIIVAHQIKFYPTEKSLKKQFTDRGFDAPQIKIIETTNGPVTIVDNERISKQPVLVFIHGSPGSSQDFRLYLQDKTLEKFRMISLNRLGFAKENYGKIELDLSKQADAYVEAINQVLDTSDKLIWIGHSYGGAPAAVCAKKAKENTSGLVLAAAPISPDHEKQFWFNKFAQFPPIYWIMPTTLKMAQLEKMTHSKELLKIENDFKQVECPMFVLQGGNDFMSPMANVDYAEKTFISSSNLVAKRIGGQSHFFPFQGREHVLDAILELTKH